MKTLIAIGIIQLAAIFWLYMKIADLDDRLDRAAATPREAVPTSQAGPAPTSALSAGNTTFLDEDRLRLIIRDELAVQFEDRAVLQSHASPDAAPTTVDPVEMEARREQLSQQLEYYVSVGRISDAEMQKLQIDIARLDAKGRTEMLRELTRALNSGRLEGQL